MKSISTLMVLTLAGCTINVNQPKVTSTVDTKVATKADVAVTSMRGDPTPGASALATIDLAATADPCATSSANSSPCPVQTSSPSPSPTSTPTPTTTPTPAPTWNPAGPNTWYDACGHKVTGLGPEPAPGPDGPNFPFRKGTAIGDVCDTSWGLVPPSSPLPVPSESP